MISLYVVLYQYLDSQESKLKYELQIMNEIRNKSTEDLQEIVYLKLKLDFLKKLSSDLLIMIKE